MFLFFNALIPNYITTPTIHYHFAYNTENILFQDRWDVPEFLAYVTSRSTIFEQ